MPRVRIPGRDRRLEGRTLGKWKAGDQGEIAGIEEEGLVDEVVVAMVKGIHEELIKNNFLFINVSESKSTIINHCTSQGPT